MKLQYDVLIVGSGVSGLYCALNLNPKLNILVISKDSIDNNNTYLAQGGISTARGKDDINLFIEDTLRAGQYKNKLESVEILANESMDNIESMINYGLNLDKEDGKVAFTREGAHSINRIVYSKDTTGKAVFETLIEECKKSKNIILYEDTCLIDIITDCDKCIGGVVIKNQKEIIICSKVVVLATGGIGGVFKNSTNQRHLTGDGLAIALKHNVKVKDINYIQIHPTAFYEENNENRKLLISESVRGEGGKLLNKHKERFVDELLPRDVVSKAIFKQMKMDNREYVYLDVTHLDSEYLKSRFSFIYEQCLIRGTDITKDYIKVAPAQHYFMGGIEVDLQSKTSMNNLYAVGEVSCTGVHGANRLASNSLLEGLVFSKRAASHINENIDNIDNIDINNINHNEFKIDVLSTPNKDLVINEIKSIREDLRDELLVN